MSTDGRPVGWVPTHRNPDAGYGLMGFTHPTNCKSKTLPQRHRPPVGASLLAIRSLAVFPDREQARSYKSKALPQRHRPPVGASLLAIQNHAAPSVREQARSYVSAYSRRES
jgi:hypothetical protein